MAADDKNIEPEFVSQDDSDDTGNLFASLSDNDWKDASNSYEIAGLDLDPINSETLNGIRIKAEEELIENTKQVAPAAMKSYMEAGNKIADMIVRSMDGHGRVDLADEQKEYIKNLFENPAADMRLLVASINSSLRQKGEQENFAQVDFFGNRGRESDKFGLYGLSIGSYIDNGKKNGIFTAHDGGGIAVRRAPAPSIGAGMVAPEVGGVQPEDGKGNDGKKKTDISYFGGPALA